MNWKEKVVFYLAVFKVLMTWIFLFALSAGVIWLWANIGLESYGNVCFCLGATVIVAAAVIEQAIAFISAFREEDRKFREANGLSLND